MGILAPVLRNQPMVLMGNAMIESRTKMNMSMGNRRWSRIQIRLYGRNYNRDLVSIGELFLLE